VLQQPHKQAARQLRRIIKVLGPLSTYSKNFEQCLRDGV
jgi:hypothetical protein